MNEKLRKKLKPEHFELIERLTKLGFTVESKKKDGKTLRIKKNGYNYGYMNKYTTQDGLFGYRFNLSSFLTDQKTFDHCPPSIVGEGDVKNALENYFFKKYGFRHGWHLKHNKSKGKFYVTINDIKLAESVLEISKNV